MNTCSSRELRCCGGYRACIGRPGGAGGQQFDQRTVLQRVGDVVARHLDHAESGQCAGDIGLGVAGRHPAPHRHAGHGAVDDEFECLRPVQRVPAEVDGGQRRDVGHLTHRRARVQQGGGGARRLSQLAQRACGEIDVARIADAQHAVDAFADQVGDAVGTAEFDADAGMLGEEGGQGRRDLQPGHARRHLDPQQPGRALADAEQLLHLARVGQEGAAARQQQLAVTAGMDAPRGALEQARAEVLFQLLHRGRDRGARHRQLFCGPAEAAGLGDTLEDAKVEEQIHAQIIR